MKIVIAPDSFKGSATSHEISQWIENGIRSVIPECEIEKILIGDGGEGSLAVAIAAGYKTVQCTVVGPSGNQVVANFGIKGSSAFIELAQASGLSQLRDGKLAPLTATSFGTGELIKAALDAGARQIIVAVGGSACTDAGAGALQALGAQLLDSAGRQLPYGGAALQDCASIDLSHLDPRIAHTEFILASDVTNPLLGTHGAAAVYAPQKGASSHDVVVLEQALSHFADSAGTTHVTTPSAGAAGGFGFMALTFLHARAESGIAIALDMADFDSALSGADLVITGEGRFDTQSLNGKAPFGILRRAQRHQVPVALICGQAALNSSDEIAAQFESITTLQSLESDITKCISDPRPIIEKIATSIAKRLPS